MSPILISNQTLNSLAILLSIWVLIILPLSMIIAVAGIITTGILHNRSSTPKKSYDLIITEAAFSFTLIIHVYGFLMIVMDWHSHWKHHMSVYIVLGILACALDIVALSMRPSQNDDALQQRLHDTVFGLLCTTVILQGICLLGTFLGALGKYEIIVTENKTSAPT